MVGYYRLLLWIMVRTRITINACGHILKSTVTLERKSKRDETTTPNDGGMQLE